MLKKIENTLLEIFFLVFSVYALVYNLLTIEKMGIIKIILVIIIFISLGYLLKKVFLKKERKLLNCISIIILVLNLILLIILGYNLKVDLTWDYGTIQKNAISFATLGEFNFDNVHYFMRYPTNELIFVVIAYVYRLANVIFGVTNIDTFKNISIAIDIILIEISYIITYKLTSKYQSKKVGILAIIMLLVTLPMGVYSSIYYSDVLVLFSFPLMFLLYLKYNDTKKIRYLILLGLVSIIGFNIKATAILALFAIFIDIVFSYDFKNILKGILIPLIVFVFGNMLMGNLTNNILGITDEDLNRYEFPHTHHIMMMLNKTGGFVQEDVNYTNSFETKKEKTDANMKVIKERLQERGTSGTLKHLFYTKFIRTWGDDTFSSSDYASRGTMKNNIITDFVTVPGKYHSYYQAYTETIYIITLVGLVLSFSLKSDNKLICLSKRTILLVALFLTLWECNSRYVIQIMPIIAIVSAYGYSLLINKLYQRKEVKK